MINSAKKMDNCNAARKCNVVEVYKGRGSKSSSWWTWGQPANLGAPKHEHFQELEQKYRIFVHEEENWNTSTW